MDMLFHLLESQIIHTSNHHTVHFTLLFDKLYLSKTKQKKM